MKQYKYNRAIINIIGEVDRKNAEEAAKIFFRKVIRCRKNNMKRNDNNGNGKR